MTTIHKFNLAITDEQDISIPGYVRVIHVGLDPGGSPCVWAVVNNLMETSVVRIFIVGTGNPIPDSAHRHLGSFLQGSFVWHALLG